MADVKCQRMLKFFVVDRQLAHVTCLLSDVDVTQQSSYLDPYMAKFGNFQVGNLFSNYLASRDALGLSTPNGWIRRNFLDTKF
jgi:hypothetical protein